MNLKVVRIDARLKFAQYRAVTVAQRKINKAVHARIQRGQLQSQQDFIDYIPKNFLRVSQAYSNVVVVESSLLLEMGSEATQSVRNYACE